MDFHRSAKDVVALTLYRIAPNVLQSISQFRSIQTRAVQTRIVKLFPIDDVM